MNGHAQEVYSMAVLAAGTALLDLTKTTTTGAVVALA